MKSILITLATILVFIQILSAQHSHLDVTIKAETEMKEAFGTIPVMFEVYPEYLRASAWNWFKTMGGPDAALPKKHAELVSLGVASQIPCDYCVYAHTTMAKMLGATDAEIKEAIAAASETRHWSTVLNGNNVSFEEFKKEWDGILEFVKKQSESK